MTTHQNLVLTALLLIASITIISAGDPVPSSNIRGKQFACPDESTIPACSCEEYGTQFMIHCPKSNPTLEVMVIEALQAVQLQCREQYDLDGLPNLAIGNRTLLKIKGCILNETQPILETFGFLGVSNVRALMYNDYRLHRIPYSSNQFEGLEKLENLTLYQGSGIQERTFERLSNLKRLYIQIENLQLQRGVFDSLSNLEVLNLEYNQINYLEEGLFQYQENLKVLSLARNTINNISKKVFQGLNNLRVLDLRANKIESLDREVFTLLPELTELNIGFNPISKIPEGILSGNRKLKTFDLRNNIKMLEFLPEDFLANLPQLKIVNLDSSKISHLPDTLLRQSTEVVTLNLKNNRLRSLPETLLRDQHQLQDLDLGTNLLETIPDELLDNCRELTTLHLSNNRLQSLSGNVFRNLKNLKKLHLENNNLQTIDHFTFSATRVLEELYLQNNLLAFHAYSFIQEELHTGESDNTPFQYLAKLRTLKLQNNSISTIFIDWNINNLELQDLDLSNNRISELYYADLQFQSNIFLNLSYNNISLIRVAVDQLSLKPYQNINVDLSNNPLDCNCYVLDFVKFVQDVKVKGLQFNTDRLRCSEPENLRAVSVSEVKTEDLKCKTIEGCPTECSCDLRPVDYTIVVNCNGRGLTRVPELPPPGLFEGFKSTELHIEDNILTELPTANLPGYDQVTQLHIRNNSIETLLPENLPTNLRLLDLTQNHLQMIDDSTVAFLNSSSQLSSIRLSNNRWRCECNTSRLLNFIQRNQKRIDDMPEIRCDNTGLPLGSTTVNDLCNEDLTMMIVICIMVAVMGLIVALFSTLFYQYQTEVKVWLFTHNLLLWLITEEELDKDKKYDAFISYSHLDEDFITEQLVPKLEKEPMNFKTCWHVRDFKPGELIMTQIVNSIQDSRRTLIVLSKNFLQSHWAQEEFRQAHVQSMEDKRVRVIVIIYDDVGDVDKLDPELRAYLKTNTYVKWGDPWFWDKLRYAMPHPMKIKGLKRGEKDILLEPVKATAPKTA